MEGSKGEEGEEARREEGEEVQREEGEEARREEDEEARRDEGEEEARREVVACLVAEELAGCMGHKGQMEVGGKSHPHTQTWDIAMVRVVAGTARGHRLADLAVVEVLSSGQSVGQFPVEADTLSQPCRSAACSGAHCYSNCCSDSTLAAA